VKLNFAGGVMAYSSAKKAAFKSEVKKGYVPYYAGLISVVPQRLGFKPNVAVVKVSNFDDVLRAVQEADFVSLDTETTGLKFAEASIVSVNIGLPGNNNFVGFYYTGFFSGEQKEKLVSVEKLDELVTAVLGKPAVFMWNRYFDQRVLMFTRGFKEEDFWRCYDGMDLLWLLDSNKKQGLGLKQSAKDFLGLPDWGVEDDVWEDILSADPRLLVGYGGYDAYATVELGMLLYRVFRKHYPFMLQLHIECKNALFRLEEQHQPLDKDWVEVLSGRVSEEVSRIKGEFFSKFGVINLASPRQKSDLLLRLGWSTNVWNKPAKDGTKIMSTAEKHLSVLAAGGCEAAALMVRCSKMLKLENSYITPLRGACESGKPIRFHFKDRDVATLRFSAGALNINRKKYDYFLPLSLQCLPKSPKVNRELNFDPATFKVEWPVGEGEYYVESSLPDLNVRKAFGGTGDTGGMVVKADFSGQEMVIPAVLSNETTWLDALKRGEDLHKATGRQVYGRDIRGDERKTIKGINFGILYEVDNPEYVVSNQTGWPIEQSREFVNKYKSTLHRLYAWKDRVILEGRTTGSVKNLYGFERRVYPYYHTADRSMHRFGDRTCVNQSIQGLAAIMARILLVKLWKLLYLPGGKYYGAGISILVSVHDEFDVWCRDRSVLPEFIPDFKDLMESVTPKGWPVPLRVEVELGENMGETFVVEKDEVSGLWLPKQQERGEGVTAQAAAPAVTQSLVDEWVGSLEDGLDEAEGFNFEA
jgi:DNA polymerase I-like protein with 3'-5' exonuclease and polymerase domains